MERLGCIRKRSHFDPYPICGIFVLCIHRCSSNSKLIFSHTLRIRPSTHTLERNRKKVQIFIIGSYGGLEVTCAIRTLVTCIGRTACRLKSFQCKRVQGNRTGLASDARLSQQQCTWTDNFFLVTRRFNDYTAIDGYTVVRPVMSLFNDLKKRICSVWTNTPLRRDHAARRLTVTSLTITC